MKTTTPRQARFGSAALVLCGVCGLFLAWGVSNLLFHPTEDFLGFPQNLALYIAPIAFLLGCVGLQSWPGKVAVAASVLIAILVLSLPWPRF